MAKEISKDFVSYDDYYFDGNKNMLMPVSTVVLAEDVVFPDGTNLIDRIEHLKVYGDDVKAKAASVVSKLSKFTSADAAWDEIISNLANASKYIALAQVFNYTNSVQTFTAPISGTYQIECAGAGSSGKGSYAKANVYLDAGTILYVYVGQQGGTFNGGGAGCSFNDGELHGTATYGSGATDVRLIKSTASDGWSGDTSLNSRIVTAGGGGGKSTSNECGRVTYTYSPVDGYSATSTRAVDSSKYYTYNATNTEASSGVLGKGNNSGLWKSSEQHKTWCDWDKEWVYATSYYVNRNLAGGGGWYGGAYGCTGTSYVNSGYKNGNKTYNLSNIEYNRCSVSGAGYARITLIN